LKVILDTNVLISGIFFLGPPSDILKAWQEGDVQFALSLDIFNEYGRVTKILVEEFPNIEINPILTLIATHSEIIQAPSFPSQVCEDPDDDNFLACALRSKSRIIITGDKLLLKITGYKGISILTPRMFIERYLRK
jgi:uncharacterized protein